ncbi:MAG TPA: DUF5004 domain-containing protein [Arachidicoccus sp.]|nr:DUF5004 domain-containing protein [Arachidicoccus sp.]
MKKMRFILLTVLIGSLFACQRETVATPMESTKTLNGTWKVIKAVRNGTDLTNRFDFSGFKISFKDSIYTMDSLVPFPVVTNGTFHLDDPKYPFKIFLKEAGSDFKSLDMEFPIAHGVRNIIFNFSPGCTSNTYQYTLQKVN